MSNTGTDWGATTMRDLRRMARPYSDMTSVFEWLKAIGLVPAETKRMDVRQVLTDLDPENISVRYLAAAAFEWDTWGPSNPDQFLNALSAETRGAKRDLIVETLSSLGRAAVEAAA